MSSNPSVFRTRIIAALGGIVLLVAACSSAGGASTAPSAAATATPAPTSASSPAASAGGLYTVTVATGAVGTFLAGEDGKTLYTFADDSANKTACTTADACATTWPPFVLEGTETVKGGDGVTGTLATFARPDGAMQVTYNGIPLYYYSGDTKAGDTMGQGLFGKWFVASPTGTLGSPAPSSSGGGRAY
jgi:predicted lipoprotein with Yx(FWY)xxD motif